MKKLILALLLAGCAPIIDRTHTTEPEYFYYSDQDIFHVARNGRVSKLSWSDIKVLGIDSLKMYYLEKNAER